MTDLEIKLLASLKDFMEMWGSRDAHSESKRAQAKRAAMWDRANAAVAKAEGRQREARGSERTPEETP